MKLDEFWRKIDPGLKFSIAAYLVARVTLTAWSLIIFIIFPTVTQNLDLFGMPILTALNLQTSERYAYSRIIGDTVLSFRADDPGFVRDVQTGSKWVLREGRAVEGKLLGQSLGAANYSVEEIFPYHGVAPEQNLLLGLWQRFDTNWFLMIAVNGYADKASTVYLPFYPFLIHWVGMIMPSALASAMLVSNLALVATLVVFYRIAKMFSDDAGAKRVVAFLLLFPTAFFLSIAYTESLFLLLTLSAFYLAVRERWLWAIGLGVLAAFTRLQGVLLIIPLAWILWRQYRASHRTYPAGRFTMCVLLLFAIPLATFVFLALTNLSLIRAYEGELHARFVLPWDNMAALLNLVMSGQASFVDLLNLAITAGTGVMLFALWKKLPGEYVLYALAMWLAPLFRMTTTQPLVSMARYALALFPMFILLGIWGKHAWVNRAVVYLSFPLQLYLSAQFILWGWVG